MYPCRSVMEEASLIKIKLTNFKPECGNTAELDLMEERIRCVRSVCDHIPEIKGSLDEIHRHLNTLRRPDIPILEEDEPPDINEAYKQSLAAADRVIAEIGKHSGV